MQHCKSGIMLLGFLSSLLPICAIEGQTFSVLYTFTGGIDGSRPQGNLIRGSSGNLYGTASEGGASSAGVVFKIDPSGNESVLYAFTGGADGGNPKAGVISDSAGNFYGTTSCGGASGAGVVFKLDSSGHASVLHDFTAADNACTPKGSMVRDCYASLIRDTAGNLYGTTFGVFGGASGGVFKLDPAGNYAVLHTFTGGDGANPQAGVTLDPAGHLYGTTSYGGDFGKGVVFELGAEGKYTRLYSFPGGTAGGIPYGGVVLDRAGNLYGTTHGNGGPCDQPTRCGVVFQLTPPHQETVLHRFKGATDGAYPDQGVIRTSAGALFGTTYAGGTPDAGVVFKVAKSGKETVLYTFTGGADGLQPFAGVIRDAAGNLYGTTFFGGLSGGSCGSGCGVVYKITP